jgi:hypothetical protein
MLIIGFGVAIVVSAPASAVTGDVAGMHGFSLELILKQSSDCDSNYSGACVPIASDVDCEGGGGNGPEYVSGPVNVTGDDIYELDRDGNGVACEA